MLVKVRPDFRERRRALAGGAIPAESRALVVSSNAITLKPLSQKVLPNGSFSASFQGVAGLVYVVDRATDIAGPWESGFTNTPAGTNGLSEISDLNIPPQPMRFYRARFP